MPNMSLETIPKRLPPFRNDSVLSYAIRIKDKSNVIWGRATVTNYNNSKRSLK